MFIALMGHVAKLKAHAAVSFFSDEDNVYLKSNQLCHENSHENETCNIPIIGWFSSNTTVLRSMYLDSFQIKMQKKNNNNLTIKTASRPNYSLIE